MNSTAGPASERPGGRGDEQSGSVRVAVLAESFLPHMNGVTGSVLEVLRHLERTGHETLVVAPRAGEVTEDLHGARAEFVPSLPMPSYPAVRVAVTRAARLVAAIRPFRPDVIHLASPFILGWQGLAVADALRVPAVAVYQTDVVGYTEKYGVPQATAIVAGHVARLHRRATLTLAPSSVSLRQLERLGVDRLRHWGRGVDTERFAPQRRSDTWRQHVAPGEVIVGYVGRLAPEKQVADLKVLTGIPGVRLVVIGDGPTRDALATELPGAVFLGHLAGDELATAMAGLDVFVHPGESETFGQTIQEAHASGVAVVATGAGGPLDLVRPSIDGWLYRPGDLAHLRAHVMDLVGDEAKRAAFGRAARENVAARSWSSLTADLVAHYHEARALRAIDDAALVRPRSRPALPLAPTPAPAPWHRYVALGDSLTEGLCDTSREPAGRYRGWADRLAELLGRAGSGGGALQYANLAVRSRRVDDLLAVQVPRALSMGPDLVSILIGANDLVHRMADTAATAKAVENAVARLRETGCTVLLVTTILPRMRGAAVFARRFEDYNQRLRGIAADHECVLLDAEILPAFSRGDMWADDRVHLRSSGHRYLAYRAAGALGVPHAHALGDLDAALHDEEPHPDGWWHRDALPWVWRRLRGRTAGDGVAAKHDAYVTIGGGDPSLASPAL